jgi:hypothetical protein
MKHYFNYDLAVKVCDKAAGSGLNNKPDIYDRKNCVCVEWDYCLMNSNGYYDGYWNFTLKIPKADPMAFVVAGKRGNPRTSAAYDLKDYLAQLFDEVTAETLQEAGISWELVNEKIYPGDKEYNPDIPFAQEHGYHFGRAHYEYAGDLQEVKV